MSDLDVAIKARFVNQMGSGARSAERDLGGVQKTAQRLGNTDFGSRLRSQLQRAAEGAASLHSRMQSVGTLMLQLGAGYQTIKRTLGAPVMADANLGDIMIDIGQKANLTKGEIGGLTDTVKAMADRLRTSPEAIGKGIDVLMGSGLDLDPSKRLIDPIVKVSKAYRVETDAVSQAVFSMVNNLKIAPDQIELALGRIAQAAADGRYEIANFAEGMPGLAATMQGLGQTGLSGISRLAAALETVSGSVGDPGQATTSIDDLLQKVVSPDVVKNFKDAGINIAGRIGKAQKEGTDVFEAIYKATMKATGGDTSKVVNFFGDKEARRGIVALMQNMDAYREMRDRYEAINAPDKLNSDFDMRTEGTGNKLRTFGDRWEALQAAVGKGVNTYLDPIVSKMTEWLDVVTKLAEKIPALTGSVVILGTTLAAMAVSASVGSMLKGLSSMLGGAGAAAGGGAATAAAAGAGAGGVGLWKWLGRGGKFALKGLGRIAGPAGWAYTGYEAGKALGDYAATPEGKAAIEKQNADDRRRMELQGRIEQLNGKVNSAISLGDLKALAEYNAEIADLYRQLNEIGKVEAKPEVDPSSIDAAIGKVSALTGALRGLGSPSFMGNAAPASARAGGRSGGAGNTSNTYNVAGYNPGVVARRIQREQDRETRLARAGALHDLWSLA
ncbi:hypothetical protein KL86PLE_20122 [uncultured Pleomorphomonas sp.]|uniref:Phage tail tape measure protein domain-containing protein n=1 Tax=uncultured Pleomorphomonas sp. TaxID=442121 RepID=A0A212LCZ4_9HYPH|nr:phage tail tape measure protein [uncultured Pleomorphomonas sp.]SCM75454.1 hypothetical protein KL86PLE_20122 [uncultured Pleomorphomonas sp.]